MSNLKHNQCPLASSVQSSSMARSFTRWLSHALGSYPTSVLAIVVYLSSASPIFAQFIAPRSLTIPSTIPSINSQYGIDTSITCPSPSFNIGAFGAFGNDRYSVFDPLNANNSSQNNYGVAAGLNIPFGTELGRFCDDYSKAKVDSQQSISNVLRRNAQIDLINQCYWLKQSGFLTEANQESFKKTPEFASLSACYEIDLSRLQAAPVTPLEPPKGTVPQQTQPLIIQQTNP